MFTKIDQFAQKESVEFFRRRLRVKDGGGTDLVPHRVGCHVVFGGLGEGNFEKGIHGGVVEFENLPERSKELILHLLVVSSAFKTTCGTRKIEYGRGGTDLVPHLVGGHVVFGGLGEGNFRNISTAAL